MKGAVMRENWRGLKGRDISLLLLLGVLVFAATWGGVELTFVTGHIAAIWLANALIVIAALKVRRAVLPAVFTVGLAAMIAGNVASDGQLADAVVLPLFNLLEAAMIVLPLIRWRLAGDFSAQRPLLTFYGLALGPACMVPAILGGAYFSLIYGYSFWQVSLHWYFGDALSLIVFVPPFAAARLRDFVDLFDRKQWRGSLLMIAGVVAVISLNVFAHDYPFAFLMFPVVLVMTFMRGFAGGTVGLLLGGGYLFGEAMLGMGTLHHPLREQVIIVQAFAAAMSFIVVVAGAVMEHRRRLEGGMAEALDHAKELREEALVAKDAAEQASRTKSMFLANMSHELRTPLNAILGFSEIMQAQMFGEMGDPKYTEYSRMIHEAGAHLLELINDILDMSKIEAGKLEIERKRLEVREVVDDCLSLMRERAHNAEVTLSGDVAPDSLWLEADRRALKQILLNLLSNAVKFTPAGGSVSVTASQVSGPGGEVSCRLAVRDTGVGIPGEALSRLGNPFVQLRDGADRAHKGTGLGLALVRALTEMHDGSFKIESVVGAGTTVSVELPQGHAAIRAA